MRHRHDADGSHGSRVAPLRGLPGMTEKGKQRRRSYFFSFHFPSMSTIVGTYWSPRPALAAMA
jgi:hypothetical protein